MQNISPQSLRGESLDGIVDMRVFTPEELQSRLKINPDGEVQMPFLGADAKRAYDALMNVMITPLCRSDEIRYLLYGGNKNELDAATANSIHVGSCLVHIPH